MFIFALCIGILFFAGGACATCLATSSDPFIMKEDRIFLWILAVLFELVGFAITFSTLYDLLPKGSMQ